MNETIKNKYDKLYKYYTRLSYVTKKLSKTQYKTYVSKDIKNILKIFCEALKNIRECIQKNNYKKAEILLEKKYYEDKTLEDIYKSHFPLMDSIMSNNKDIVKLLPKISEELFEKEKNQLIRDIDYTPKMLDVLCEVYKQKTLLSHIIISTILNSIVKKNVLKNIFTITSLSSGANGKTYLISYKDIKFILKKSTNKNLNMFSESYIAYHCTNYIKALIPNFSYTYTCFKGKNEDTYCIMEYIDSSEHFKEFVVNYSLNDNYNELSNILAQINLSLYIAQNMNGYKHNDFHYNNVLIKKNDEIKEHIFYIPKKSYMKNQTYTKIIIKSMYTAYIIDFGYSSMDNDSDMIYSGIFNPLINIYPYFCLPHYDLTTLIGRTYGEAKKQNKTNIANFLKKLKHKTILRSKFYYFPLYFETSQYSNTFDSILKTSSIISTTYKGAICVNSGINEKNIKRYAKLFDINKLLINKSNLYFYKYILMKEVFPSIYTHTFIVLSYTEIMDMLKEKLTMNTIKRIKISLIFLTKQQRIQVCIEFNKIINSDRYSSLIFNCYRM